MAEGLLRRHSRLPLEVFSAGNAPAQVHPLAVQTMADMGIDISQQQPTHLDEFTGQRFDLVITVCDKMREVCPVFADASEQIHWSIADPAEVGGTEADQRRAFQLAARELESRVRFLLITLESASDQYQEASS